MKHIVVDIFILTTPAAIGPGFLEESQLGGKGHDERIVLVSFLNGCSKIVTELRHG